MRRTSEAYQEQADRAIIKLLSGAGPEGMNSNDLLQAAAEIPAEPTRMHRFGDRVLRYVGKRPEPKRRYLPSAAAYRRLIEKGVIVTSDQTAADSPDGVSHVINRLAETDNRNPEDYQPSFHDVALLPVTPNIGSNLSLTEQLFKSFETAGSKAIVLIGYATGTTPSALNPYIRKSVDSGVPVFVLSHNKGQDTGIQKIAYMTQKEAVDAGATPLRDVNVNHAEEVAAAIQTEIDAGKTGAELSRAITEIYGSPVSQEAA